MKALTPEELKSLREDVAELGYPDETLDEIIRTVDAIVTSIIDQEYGFHSVQLSLSKRANYSFAKSHEHASLSRSSDAILKEGSFGNANTLLIREKDLEP